MSLVAVTGGTGHLGACLVRQLVQVSKLPAACSLEDLVIESFRCASKPSVGQVPRGT
ncbi:MAG TPA: hypothetical protein VML75_26570 [Kofleriaceae bacterium]|nr:hypothetical protein [Kofleriaceae bacterium]